MASHSNGTSKPSKPHRDFPLTPHPSGRWCKKVKGKLAYFGYWRDDPKGEAALELWLAQKDDLLAGRKPRLTTEGVVNVDYLVNHFLAAKDRAVEAGKIQRRTWSDYERVCKHIVNKLGRARAVCDLRSEDFGLLWASMAKGQGVISLGNQVRLARCVFKYGYDADLIDRPVKFGPEFKVPDKASRRKAKNARPARLLDAAEINSLIGAASVQLKAMIYLGINAGMGNNDCSELPRSALDLKRGVLDFPRPKTGVDRRAVLWPETVAAIEAAIAVRPKAKDPAHDGLVFMTRFGKPWVRFRESGTFNSISLEFGKLMTLLGLDKIGEKDRSGVGFYSLRHTFETVASRTGDQVAVDRIMGHVSPGMGEEYRHWHKDTEEDARLRKVTDHVRAWLMAKGGKEKKAV